MYNKNAGFGQLLAQALHGLRPTTGKVFVVGDAATVNVDMLKQVFGLDPDGTLRFFSTIDAAVGACTANAGDVIVVAPGHTETVTAAGGLDLDVAGITIIGLGSGSDRPKIHFTTATTADMDVDADNVTIENVVFDLTGVDALVAPIDVNKLNFTMRTCDVVTASDTAQATLAILTDANAGGVRLEGNRFLGSADAGTAAAVRIVGGNDHVLRGNVFIGNYTTSLGAIDNATTACLNVLVEGNFIYNRTALSTKAMVFVSTSTGIIANNRMQILSGTAPITGAAMSWAGGNYYAATIATAGTLI